MSLGVSLEISNSYFAYQCSLAANNNLLPSELKLLKKHLTSFDFSETDNLQIINNQDSNN